MSGSQHSHLARITQGHLFSPTLWVSARPGWPQTYYVVTESTLELRILLPTLPNVLEILGGPVCVLLQSQLFKAQVPVLQPCLHFLSSHSSCCPSCDPVALALRPHCLGHCNPSATGLFSKTKTFFPSGATSSLALCCPLVPCPHDCNDLGSSSTQAAGGPPELSHRPGNSALMRLSQANWVLSIWPKSCESPLSATEMAEEMGIFWQNTQKVFPQLQLWSMVSHLTSALQNYPLRDVLWK